MFVVNTSCLMQRCRTTLIVVPIEALEAWHGHARLRGRPLTPSLAVANARSASENRCREHGPRVMQENKV